MRRILSALSAAALAATLWAAPAVAQNYQGWENVIPPDQLGNFSNYLAQHPETARFLNSNPNANGYQNYLRSNSSFAQFLSTNPKLQDYISRNPGWYSLQEQQYLGSRGFDGQQTVAIDRFLNNHPGTAETLSQDPQSTFTRQYLHDHPQFADFLKAHPYIGQKLRQNPWTLSPRGRMTQKDWWLNRWQHQREEALEEDEEEAEHHRRHGDHDEDYEAREGHHDNGRHLGWDKDHHGDHDSDDHDHGHGHDHD